MTQSTGLFLENGCMEYAATPTRLDRIRPDKNDTKAVTYDNLTD